MDAVNRRGSRIGGPLLAIPVSVLLASCIAPGDPEPIDLPAALSTAEAEGRLLVPSGIPDDAFVSWASQVTEDGVPYFGMTINRSPSGLAHWCVVPQEHADQCSGGVSSGTIDGLFWSVSGLVPTEGNLRDGTPTADWRSLDWVAGNESRQGRR